MLKRPVCCVRWSNAVSGLHSHCSARFPVVCLCGGIGHTLPCFVHSICWVQIFPTGSPAQSPCVASSMCTFIGHDAANCMRPLRMSDSCLCATNAWHADLMWFTSNLTSWRWQLNCPNIFVWSRPVPLSPDSGITRCHLSPTSTPCACT